MEFCFWDFGLVMDLIQKKREEVFHFSRSPMLSELRRPFCLAFVNS